ncbi:MAG: radical SAM protein [Deltaproteobacteria bacterium]|nr:radical SAM protein [Deltaproteobacteria bacterium]
MTLAPDLGTLSPKAQRAEVLRGIREGRPRAGPVQVHIDVTNTCNATCVTCWDHSPLLKVPRPPEWKRRRLDFDRFCALLEDLGAMGSVRAVLLSGMGEPLTHPRIYEMIAEVKARGWHLTLITNLVAADIDRLAQAGVDQLLVGIHGVTPAAYSAFHPGWTEQQFFQMCRHLRVLASAGVRCRHVQVVNRDTASQVVDMVRFGRMFRADRVNYKLASLSGGTEVCATTREQRAWLLAEAIPDARTLARELGVPTNLGLFERQVRTAVADTHAITPIEVVGCFMGHVYARVTTEGEVLYCCNTRARVDTLDTAPLSALWRGARWQALRDRLRAGAYLEGCDRCGKFEQNAKWSERYRAFAGEAAWRAATGQP